MMKIILFLSILNINSISTNNNYETDDKSCGRCKRCPLSWNSASRFGLLTVNFIVLVNQSFNFYKHFKLINTHLMKKKQKKIN